MGAPTSARRRARRLRPRARCGSASASAAAQLTTEDAQAARLDAAHGYCAHRRGGSAAALHRGARAQQRRARCSRGEGGAAL
jgi:hypothetical protein